MDLKIYGNAAHLNGFTISCIGMSVISNSAWFNIAAIRNLDLKEGQRILFGCDEKTNSWYFTYGFEIENGTKLRNESNNTNSLRCSCKRVAHLICEKAKSTSITCAISKKPKIINGRPWYNILTATPLRAK